jgi:FkbM family methyltransferase
MHPRIFYEFERKKSVSDGCSVYDFIGSAIEAAYKCGWGKNIAPSGEVIKPGYPQPSEWTVDWIACLLSAKLAGDRFNVIELGAGYGQWMVTSILAYKALNPDCPAHGMAVEAEKTHYEWLQSHVKKNLGSYDDVRTDLLFAAVGYDGVALFPTVAEPAQNYGAAYQSPGSGERMQETECLSMRAIDARFSEATVDLIHVDIQGAEADLIANPGFEEALAKTRFALFGTHRSNDLHHEVKKRLEVAGMHILIEWPRQSVIETPFGSINTNDGAILAANPDLSDRANELLVAT